MDSNELEEGWKDAIDRVNPNSEYHWEKVTNELIEIENEFHTDNHDDQDAEEIVNNVEEHDDQDAEEIINNIEELVDDVDVVGKDLPKRVLVFSSKKLIRQLSRNLKSSVDGTFKSSC